MLNLIGVILAFIVIIIRKKIKIEDFGTVLILGALLIGVFSLRDIHLVDIPKAFVEASIYSFETRRLTSQPLELAILMALIYMLARALQETGAINSLIVSLKTVFPHGGTLAVVPAVYGLMPVLGGALLSAPMIDAEGNKYKLNKDQKNFLNMLSYFLVKPFFPLVGLNPVGLASIIYVSACAGYLLSPIHLCNVLSSEYLETDTTRMYQIFMPAIILLLGLHILFIARLYG